MRDSNSASCRAYLWRGCRARTALALLLLSSTAASVDDPPWPQYGGGATHTSALDRDLMLEGTRLLWSRQVLPGNVRSLTVGSGRVFASTSTGGNGATAVVALAIATGAEQWHINTDNVFYYSTAPAYDYQSQSLVHSTANPTIGEVALRCYSAVDGTLRWVSTFPANVTDSPFGPTIIDGFAYVPASWSAGLVKVRMSDGANMGSALFFASGNDFAATPLGPDRLLVNSNSLLVVDRATMATQYGINDPVVQGGYGLQGQAAVLTNEGLAVLVTNNHLIAFDVAGRATAWSFRIGASGQVGYDGRDLFAPASGALSVRDPLSGAARWAWEPPTGYLRRMIIFRDHVAAMTGEAVHLVNRTSRAANHVIELSQGLNPFVMAYADDTLLVGFGSGHVAAFRVPSTPLLADGFE